MLLYRFGPQKGGGRSPYSCNLFWQTKNGIFGGHVCHGCGFKAKTKHALRVHTFYKHEKEPSVFNCEFEGCDYTSNYKENLTHHLRGKHTQIKYTCPVCNITIPRQEKEEHLRLHSDANLFYCDVCDFFV